MTSDPCATGEYAVRTMFPSNDLTEPPTPKSDETCPPGKWFPCQQPERPVDRGAVFHDCCTACWLAAEASERNGLNHRHGYGGESMAAVMRRRLDEWGEAPT